MNTNPEKLYPRIRPVAARAVALLRTIALVAASGLLGQAADAGNPNLLFTQLPDFNLGTLTMRRCTLTRNSASNQGGALYTGASYATGARALLINCTIADNTGLNPGIMSDSARLNLINVTIRGNLSPGGITTGGGIRIASGSPPSVFTTSSPLPEGVTLAASGVLSGNPPLSVAGIHAFSVEANNGVAPAASQSFTLTITEPASLVVNTTNDVVSCRNPCGGKPGLMLRICQDEIQPLRQRRREVGGERGC